MARAILPPVQSQIIQKIYYQTMSSNFHEHQFASVWLIPKFNDFKYSANNIRLITFDYILALSRPLTFRCPNLLDYFFAGGESSYEMHWNVFACDYWIFTKAIDKFAAAFFGFSNDGTTFVNINCAGTTQFYGKYWRNDFHFSSQNGTFFSAILTVYTAFSNRFYACVVAVGVDVVRKKVK